jgi:hypothetical protein
VLPESNENKIPVKLPMDLAPLIPRTKDDDEEEYERLYIYYASHPG